MKVFIILLLTIISFFRINAQSFHSAQDFKKETVTRLAIYNPKNVYLGVETGVNSYTGILGLSAFIRANKTLFIKAGIGEGSWGYKTSVGLKLDNDSTGNWSYGIGYSLCSGANNVKINMSAQNVGTKDVSIDLYKASCIQFTITRNWKVGCNRTNIIYLDLGYSFALEKKRWKVTDGSNLTDESISLITFLQPGGLILGFGFTFGL